MWRVLMQNDAALSNYVHKRYIKAAATLQQAVICAQIASERWIDRVVIGKKNAACRQKAS
tara:strand:- start:122 stop:301 length:180 start_codon:yes stop_codon:yes gene_type:complete